MADFRKYNALRQTFCERRENVTAAETFNVPVALTKHQIIIEPNGGSTGTIAVTAKDFKATVSEALPGTITIHGSATRRTFEGRYEEIILTPTGFNGTDYDIIINSWR